MNLSRRAFLKLVGFSLAATAFPLAFTNEFDDFCKKLRYTQSRNRSMRSTIHSVDGEFDDGHFYASIETSDMGEESIQKQKIIDALSRAIYNRYNKTGGFEFPKIGYA